jgi:VanZ family protein
LKKIKVILVILIIINLSLIFSNSLKTAEVSRQESGAVVEAVEKIVKTIYNGNPPEKIDDFFDRSARNTFRDIAHLLEFFVLGILVMLYGSLYRKKPIYTLIAALTFCLAVSIVDETIQIPVAGRGFELYDIILDTAGSLAGILIIYLPLYFRRKHHK